MVYCNGEGLSSRYLTSISPSHLLRRGDSLTHWRTASAQNVGIKSCASRAVVFVLQTGTPILKLSKKTLERRLSSRCLCRLLRPSQSQSSLVRYHGPYRSTVGLARLSPTMSCLTCMNRCPSSSPPQYPAPSLSRLHPSSSLPSQPASSRRLTVAPPQRQPPSP